MSERANGRCKMAQCLGDADFPGPVEGFERHRHFGHVAR